MKANCAYLVVSMWDFLYNVLVKMGCIRSLFTYHLLFLFVVVVVVKVMNAVGVVRGIDEDHDVVVQYPSRQRYIHTTENLYEWQLFATFSFVDTDFIYYELFSTILRN